MYLEVWRIGIACGMLIGDTGSLWSMFFGHIALPIGYDECGERQGYDESDKAEESSPHRKTEQENGRIEAHGLTHNLGCCDEVGDNLNHNEHNDSQPEYPPKVLSCIGSFEHGQKGCGNQCKGVKIRYQVKDANEDTQADGHREADDGETDTEHDAHAEGYQSLSANVVVEFAFYILHQFVPKWTILLWEYSYPVLREVFVVEKDKEHI